MTRRPNTTKLTFAVGRVVRKTEYWCTRCGWADAAAFSTNPRTGQRYQRCDSCRKLRGKESK